MRHALIATLLSCTTSLAPLAAASFIERQPAQQIELAQLLAAPASFYNTRVKFRCVYVQRGALYDAHHTQFNTEQYINLVAWDDNARLWDPAVRSQPMVTLYVAKSRALAGQLNRLKKYQVIELSGEVTSTFGNQPWINVHEITELVLPGAFTENAIYHLEQAAVLAKDGVHDLAESHYVSAQPDKLPAVAQVMIANQRARNALAAGRHQAAVDVLKPAVALIANRDKPLHLDAKDKGDLYHQLARAQVELANRASEPQRAALFADAVASSRAAVAEDPTQGDPYATLGISLAGLGQFDEARRECAEAIRLQPTNAEVRWHLGRILDQQGRHDEAIDALKKAIDLTPKDHRAHQAIAAAYCHRAQKGGPEAGPDVLTALREYDIALRLSPNHPDLLLDSGLAMEVATEIKVELPDKKPASYELAIERFKAAIAANPKLLAAHLALARRWQALGKPENALTSLKAAMELEPGRLEPVLALAGLQLATGQKAEAYATFEQANKLAPKNLEVMHQLGRLAIELSQPAKAVAWLEPLTKASPKHVRAQLDLAEAYLATSNPKDALKRAKTAADVATTAEDKAAAQAMVERCNAAVNPPKAEKK